MPIICYREVPGQGSKMDIRGEECVRFSTSINTFLSEFHCVEISIYHHLQISRYHSRDSTSVRLDCSITEINGHTSKNLMTLDNSMVDVECPKILLPRPLELDAGKIYEIRSISNQVGKYYHTSLFESTSITVDRDLVMKFHENPNKYDSATEDPKPKRDGLISKMFFL